MGVSPSSPASRRVVMAAIPSPRRMRSATAITRSLGLPRCLRCILPAMSTLYTTVAAVLLAAPLSGTWRVSLHEEDGVELDFRMTVEQKGSGAWEGYSRP